MMSVLIRNNVQVRGDGRRPMLFAHGFGCDQNMWRHVAPAFENDFRTILFDHVGAGKSDLDAFAPQKYSSLQGYADDVLDICRALDLRGVTFVGHSVSAMIGILASARAPELFEQLVLVGPSPRPACVRMHPCSRSRRRAPARSNGGWYAFIAQGDCDCRLRDCGIGRTGGPALYDEARQRRHLRDNGAIPVFNFGVGNNVIAGSQFFSGPDFAIADLDVFSFVVPENSVLIFVAVEFGAFEFTGPLVGFGPNYTIQRGA